MLRARFKTRHAKRLLAALCSTFVAAGAMAYSTGGLQFRHADEAPHGAHGGGHGGGGSEYLNGGAQGALQDLASGGPQGAFGPGDAHDGHDGAGADGFMPNGEDGLMALADYARRGSAGGDRYDNSESNPGNPPAGLTGGA